MNVPNIVNPPFTNFKGESKMIFFMNVEGFNKRLPQLVINPKIYPLATTYVPNAAIHNFAMSTFN